MSAINRNDTEDFLGFDIFILLIFYRRRQATREIGREIKAKYIQRNSFLLIDWYSVCVCACVSLYVCACILYMRLYSPGYTFFIRVHLLLRTCSLVCVHMHTSPSASTLRKSRPAIRVRTTRIHYPTERKWLKNKRAISSRPQTPTHVVIDRARWCNRVRDA